MRITGIVATAQVQHEAASPDGGCNHQRSLVGAWVQHTAFNAAAIGEHQPVPDGPWHRLTLGGGQAQGRKVAGQGVELVANAIAQVTFENFRQTALRDDLQCSRGVDSLLSCVITIPCQWFKQVGN